ncbi:ABC transporter ATP-binding protein [Candidatus Poriferisocius sp.]|uniref:ABC transporter ATP-binding protein n=1 Tax=Candidatus Poriferisocius sp. TaxID=3101276 RepID=UPI003B5B7604
MIHDATTGTGEGGESSPSPAVELVGITKRFGGIVACDQVDLNLHRGSIHGILGENGAGKSTLMKVLIGLVLPDAGAIRIDGRPLAIHDPMTAAAHGIAMVHQHFSLVEPLTVWENVALGESGRLDPDGVRHRIAAISSQYGLHIDPDARVADLTAGLRQRVEIIKCLRRDPRIVVFDEPTSVLTPEESGELFATLRAVVESEERAVVLVSHKLDEVLSATDEITIMRQGQVVDRLATEAADARTLARSMVGREVSLRSERAAFGLIRGDDGPTPDPPASVATPAAGSGNGAESTSTTVEPTGPLDQSPAAALCLEQVRVMGRGGRVLLDDVSLELRSGEIVGVAGVEGNGQRTLGDLLSSLEPLTGGRVMVGGEEVPANTPGAMARAGIAVIPEDRHDSGVVLDMSVAENLLMVDPHRAARRGVIDKGNATSTAQQLIDDFEIACTGPDAPLWSLSGGNQQRVVLARELAAEPRVLVAAQPTRGLDVGAIEYMTDRLRRTADSGVAVLLISSELEEILELADRVVVMFRGGIAAQLDRHEADLETLGLLMGGAET